MVKSGEGRARRRVTYEARLERERREGCAAVSMKKLIVATIWAESRREAGGIVTVGRTRGREKARRGELRMLKSSEP